MKTPTRFLSVLLLLAAALLAQAAPPLRIGTWNIEFFGNRKDPKLGDRTPEDISRMGAWLSTIGFAVLAVQEIAGEEPLRQLCRQMGGRWDFVLGTTGGWTDNSNRQSIGFLYDQARVELLQAEELLDFPRELEGVPIFHRVPVTACFRDKLTGFDFRAVTVHLKAGQKKEDEQKRRLEATTLHDWLQKLEATPGEDQDIVVLGDFNSTYGKEAELALERDAVVRWIDPPQRTPTIQHFPEPIDQIAPAPGFTELQVDTFTVRDQATGKDKEAWRKTFSDHYPVSVDIVAERDTDPDATFLPCNPQHRLPATRRGRSTGAQASDSAPAGAGAPPAARPLPLPNLPIAVGDRVEVRCHDGDQFTGTLLAPLADWVYLQCDGRIVALPRERITSVVRQ